MSGHHHTCPWWLAWTFDNPLRRFLHPPEQVLRGLIGPGGTAVDIGCGLGYFTIALARLVGPTGRVVAVDLQEQMLARARKRAKRAGVDDRVVFHRSDPDRIGLREQADLVVAFWMVHEVRDRDPFLREVRGLLRPGGNFLVAEPRMHVPAADLRETVAAAGRAGLEAAGEPSIGWSRAVLFRAVREP